MLMHLAPWVLAQLVPPFGCSYRFGIEGDLRPPIPNVKSGSMLVEMCR